MYLTRPVLTGEKTRLVRQLKAEADRIKQLRSQNEREIDQLKRKEKAAAELAKRLERSNQLQVCISGHNCPLYYFNQFFFLCLIASTSSTPDRADGDIKQTGPTT